MVRILCSIFIISLAYCDFLQVFLNSSMTSSDLIYRSTYIYQAIVELSILFQAGTSGSNTIKTSFCMPKYTYYYLEFEYKENSTLPKSIGVNTTIFLKNGMNDTSIWTIEESSKYRRVNFYTTKSYFIANGIFSEKVDPNGVLCHAYTIICQFYIQTTENTKLESVGKLIGLVSLLVPKSTTASTYLQTVLFNSTKSEFVVNTNVTSTFQTCYTSTDCSISPSSYKLNENAFFLLKLNENQFHSTYYLRNLYVTLAKDNDPALDISSLITVISSQNTIGEIMFQFPMVIVPERYLTIAVCANLKSQARRVLEVDLNNQGVFNYAVISISEENEVSYSPSFFLTIFFIEIVLFFL